MLKVTRWALALGCAVAPVCVAQPAWAFNYECRGDQAKCPTVKCSGDETACAVLSVRQDGVDHDTGAHFLVGFTVTSQPQTMEFVLTVGEQLSNCTNGSAREVYANGNSGDARSIDGLLCKLRATWTRH